MKKILSLFAIVGLFTFSGCSDDDNVVEPEYDTISTVFDIKNVSFAYNATDGYNIYQEFGQVLFPEDVVLIYRQSGTLSGSNIPIWQQIPRTLYTGQGELDYDFDFSDEDFTIYAGGNYNLSLTPQYLNNQTFRIVIVPGSLSGSAKSVNKPDYSDYNAVIKRYNIDDSIVKQLN